MIGRILLVVWTCGNTAYILSTAHETCTAVPLWVLILYLAGELAYQVLSFIVDLLTFIVSKTGTMQKNEVRAKWMPVLLTIRIIFYIPELALIVFGLTIAWYFTVDQCDVHIHNLIAAFSIVVAVGFIFKIVLFCVLMEPCGCCSPGPIHYIKDTESHDGGQLDDLFLTPLETGGTLGDSTDKLPSVVAVQPRRRSTLFRRGTEDKLVKDPPVYNRETATLWQRRFQKWVGNSGRGNTAIHDVAKLFGLVLGENEYVISDLVAGLSLEREEQKSLMSGNECHLDKLLRMKLLEQMTGGNFVGGKSKYKYRPPTPFDDANQAERAELDDIVYYFRYAEAVYGWPLVLFEKPLTGCCSLCSLSCSIVHHRGWRNLNCNDAAFWHLSQLQDCEDTIVHTSKTNKMFQSPYMVLMDHKRKALVVTIRGSLSLEDSLTCMSVHLTPLESTVPELKGLENYVHQGWHETAMNIYTDLNRHKILDRKFTEYPDYRLVVVGHSLGGAVASILAVLIKFHLKKYAHRLKCFSYSSPGSVFSYSVATYCKPFVTSVILDNDISPRLNWRALLYFKKSLVRHITTSKKPKYQILYTDPISSFLKCGGGGDDDSDDEKEGQISAKKAKRILAKRPSAFDMDQPSDNRQITDMSPILPQRRVSPPGKGSSPPLSCPYKEPSCPQQEEYCLQKETSCPIHEGSPPVGPRKLKFNKISVIQKAFIDKVYNEPDWDCLGHFCPAQISFGGAVAAVLAAGKWKSKTFGPTDPAVRPRKRTNSFEREARTLNVLPSFVAGKVLQITTRKKSVPCCPWLQTTHYDLHWKANEDYRLIRLEGGSPLRSHLPSSIGGALSSIRKSYLYNLNLENVEPPLDEVNQSNGLKDIAEEDEEDGSGEENGIGHVEKVDEVFTTNVQGMCTADVEIHCRRPQRPEHLFGEVM
jgi:hypothetical protein